MRTSTGISSRPPIRSTTRSCRKRSSFACKRARQVADLVEEQRAAVGVFDLPLRLLRRAGERAALVAEQLALEQVLGDRRAVERDELLVLARRQVVQAAREQLLAGAALAEQQHRHVGRREPLDVPAERSIAGSRVSRPASGSCMLTLCRTRFSRCRPASRNARSIDEVEQLGLERLRVEIVGAEADRLDRVRAVVLAGDHDDLRVRRDRQHLGEQREALGRAVRVRRQPEVHRDDRRLVATQLRHRGRAVLGDDDLVAVEAPAHLLLDAGVVLDDEQHRLLVGRLDLRPRRRGGRPR